MLREYKGRPRLIIRLVSRIIDILEQYHRNFEAHFRIGVDLEIEEARKLHKEYLDRMLSGLAREVVDFLVSRNRAVDRSQIKRTIDEVIEDNSGENKAEQYPSP